MYTTCLHGRDPLLTGEWGRPQALRLDPAHPKDVAKGSWSTHEKELKDRHNTADERHEQGSLLKINNFYLRWKNGGQRRRHRESERERALCAGVWISIFYGQLLMRRLNIYYLRWVFLGNRVLQLSSQLGGEFQAYFVSHFGPIWFDAISCGFVLGCYQTGL